MIGDTLKKIAFAVLALLVLVVGLACAASICPFENTTPQEFNPDDVMTSSTFSVNLAGVVVGANFGSESILLQTNGLMEKDMSYTNNLMSDHGKTSMAKQTVGTLDGLDTIITTSNAVDFNNIGFGGRAIGDESYLIDFVSDANGDIEDSGYAPFCERVGGDFGYVINNGAIASELAMSQLVIPTLPLDISYNAVVGPSTGSSTSMAIGTVTIGNYINTMQGMPVNGSAMYDVATETQYNYHDTMIGGINTVYQFEYKSTHGRELPSNLFGGIEISCR